MACTCGSGACSASYREECRKVQTSSVPSVPKKPRSVDAIDLSQIQKQLIRKGWSWPRSYAAMRGYLGFLEQFVGKNPKTVKGIRPPTQDVDDFWHQHILNTSKYEKDCLSLFGFYLHHDPDTEPAPALGFFAKVAKAFLG